MEAIDDRTLITVGNVEYVGVIHYDEYGHGNPITEYDHAEQFRLSNASRWEAELFGDSPDFPSTWDMQGTIPERYILAIDNAEYGPVEELTEAWLHALRRYDPSGVYLAFRYVESNHGPGTSSAGIVDDDEGNGIAFATSAAIREAQMCTRITAKIRQRVESNIAATLKTWTSWANGDVYGWELLRQTVDDDGEVLESESLDSCWGYIGSDEWEYMYSEAADWAQWHARQEADSLSSAYEAMDQFNAADIAA